jgi:multidrug efflux pump subunit AcrB
VFFQPGAKVEAAVAQLTSITQTILRVMPPGITPPLIVQYSASNVPILQLGVSSKTLSEQQLYDYLVLDNIGLPVGGVNLAFSDSSTIGLSDGEILVALNPEHHSSTWQYVKELRQRLNAEFPHVTFFFQPADIISQILNFGLPAPIDIQVVGRDLQANYAIAKQIEARVARIPGAADVHVHQIVDAPQLFVNVDHT